MATVTKEKLHCEIGNHNWTRETGKRGRKPANCPKHAPIIVAKEHGPKELYCVNGKHKWVREPKRGRVPASCPDHTITVQISSAPRNENGKVTLHCETGNHDWERESKKGKRPTNCPEHSPTAIAARTPVEEKRKPGRPRIHETPEEAEAAKLARSQERAANLDSMLKERGTHVTQWAEPFILYKLTDTKKGRNGRPDTTTWDKVGEYTPLSSAQWVNANEKAYADGLYRFERNGKVVNLL